MTALALLAVSGLAHGLLTSRWQPSEALAAARSRVPLVPLTIGGWQGRDLPTDPEAFAQARAEAYWMRHYQEGPDGPGVTAILMCGQTGPLAVHTPDICYPSAGYAMTAPETHIDIPLPGAKRPAQLWTAVFRKELPTGSNQLRLFWTWNASGSWQAPASPRLAFAGEPAIFKLYVVHELVAGEPLDRDLALEFLVQLLPALNKTLFSAPED
jgi:hypothetical protein